MKFIDKSAKFDWFSLIILIPAVLSIANFLLRIVNDIPLARNILISCATLFMAAGLLLYYWGKIAISITALSVSLSLFCIGKFLFGEKLDKNIAFWGLCAFGAFILVNELLLRRISSRRSSNRQ